MYLLMKISLLKNKFLTFFSVLKNILEALQVLNQGFFNYMHYHWLIIFIIVCSLTSDVQGQYVFDFNDDIKTAYREASTLRIDLARKRLSRLKETEPDNALIAYIENYADFFQLFIQEDYKLYKTLSANKGKRLDIIKKGNPKSPYYLFCQAEILLQWATVRLKFDEKIGSARDVYEAYRLLEKNRELFPDFQENYKSLSIIHALAESVPSWVRKLMGVEGSVALGTKEIKQLAEHPATTGSIYRDEIIAIYSYILLYLNNQKEEAYQLFAKYPVDHKSSPLICFLRATVTHKSGRNEEALQILAEKPRGKEYLEFYYLDFLTGKYKLYKLDPEARTHILRFVNGFKGRHYIKEAWQKLAWYELLVLNDKTAYEEMRKACLSKGFKLIDEDIQAYREASSESIPDRDLLSARLLFDGGYYKQAYDLLKSKNHKYKTGLSDGEYYYRMGRISNELGNNAEAKEYYLQTLVKGDPGKYYPCSSALHLGLLTEAEGDLRSAKKYFNQCLSLNPEGYSSSLHQKAKAGLDRLKAKK